MVQENFKKKMSSERFMIRSMSDASSLGGCPKLPVLMFCFRFSNNTACDTSQLPAPFDPSPASYDKVDPAIGRCFAIQGRKCRPTRVVLATVHLQRSGNSDSSGCDIHVVDVDTYIYIPWDSNHH